MNAPRITTSSTRPSCATICAFVDSTPSCRFVVSSKPKHLMRRASATCIAAIASPAIVSSCRIRAIIFELGSSIGAPGHYPP